MNSAQRWLVLASLVGIGVVLPFILLEWLPASWAYPAGVKILTLPPAHLALYATNGIPGFLLGVIVPLCLFAAAAFIALGTKPRK
jgi:hypothetical protein